MKRILVYASAALMLWSSTAAHAQSGGGLIRDAEIEQTLRAYTNPVLRVASLPPENVRIFIINDRRINAFVAGGLNLFLHTGLILETETPDMLLGVIAHEVGHLEGAHLSRLSASSDKIQLGSLLSVILGAAIGVAGGAEAGVAANAIGQNAFLRNFLGGIRTNEQSADQAALRYVSELGYSAQGMEDMFTLLRQRNPVSRNIDPYLLTHPLSQERVSNVRSYIERSDETRRPTHLNARHARMRAKLYAFLNSPSATFARYPEYDKSVAARLARSIAHFRRPNIDAALEGIDGLLAEYPDDPFFHDMKGQILFEHGRAEEAIISYQNAVDLLKDSGLLWGALGGAQLAAEKIDSAIISLERSTNLDNSNRLTWHQLGVAYGRAGKLPESYIALAEEAALSTDYKTIRRFAKRAQKAVAETSPIYRRAEILLEVADNIEKRLNG